MPILLALCEYAYILYVAKYSKLQKVNQQSGDKAKDKMNLWFKKLDKICMFASFAYFLLFNIVYYACAVRK